MKITENLDIQCEKIFNLLALNIDPITFNKMYDKLQTEMTKPTLIKHLDHLQKNKIIKRARIGKQKVTYEIHPEFFNELQKEKEFIESAEKLTKYKENFNNATVAGKVDNIILLMMITEIHKLKNALQSTLEPNKTYENNLTFSFIKASLNHMIQYLFSGSLKSETEVKEALREIEEIEKKYWVIALNNSKIEN
jgi:hypothetical protein